MKTSTSCFCRFTAVLACSGALSAWAAGFVSPNVESPPAAANVVALGGQPPVAFGPATPHVVTTTRDSGIGSLRWAIAEAAPGETIRFALCWPATIVTTNTLVIDKDLNIVGPRHPDWLVVMRRTGSNTPPFRVFRVDSGNVFLSGLTVRNGRALNSTGTNDNLGGGILNFGSLTVSNCVLTGNLALTENGGKGFGAGIFSTGPLTLLDSTISDNSATYAGGGVCTFHSPQFTARGCTLSRNAAGIQGGGLNFQGVLGWMQNCTVSGNLALNFDNLGGGGGIVNIGFDNEASTLTLDSCTVAMNSCDLGAGIVTVALPGNLGVATKLKDTLVAGNLGDNFATDGTPVVQSLGHNLDSDGTSGFVNGTNGDIVGTAASPVDALIGPLQDNGGPTETHALLVGSPALDAADCTDAAGNPLKVDQRGFPRQVGTACDIGAFENQPPNLICPPAQKLEATSTNGAKAVLKAIVSDPDGDALVVIWVVDGKTCQTNQVAATHPPACRVVQLTTTLSLGTHPITVWVSDGKAPPMACATKVTVRDTCPPRILSVKADPKVLQPPNGKLVPVAITVRATDACGPVTSKIVSVTSSEPVGGDGTSPDWIITGDLTVSLRAEVNSRWFNRIYRIKVECRDSSGNASYDTVTVLVPHENGRWSGFDHNMAD